VPPDQGYYTVDDRPNPGCYYKDTLGELAPRRRDVPAPKWGVGGVPSQTSCRGGDVTGVLAVDETRPLQCIQTEQGPINLPYGPDTSNAFVPRVVTLNALPFTGSRFSGISDRYYR
jgi:hypothetical protein